MENGSENEKIIKIQLYKRGGNAVEIAAKYLPTIHDYLRTPGSFVIFSY
jgi:hypothetical protein